MKKRILALALCLVMAVSLLPITAAAVEGYTVKSVEIEADGVYWDSRYSIYFLNITKWKMVCDERTFDSTDPDAWFLGEFPELRYQIPDGPLEGKKYRVHIVLSPSGRSDNFFDWKECDSFILSVPGYETVGDQRDEINWPYSPKHGPEFDFDFFLTKKHEHDWRFTQTDSTLTATCQKSTCPTKEVSVSLKADSVTLPDSPFNARLEGLEQFKEAFPNAVIGDFVYKYKGADGWTVVEPTAANAKAGEYQVGVQISNLPAPVEQDGPVAYALNQDGAGYTAELYVKYTAVDPAVTAQTGDSRPIEIMMACAAGFSLLAAAAFILDKKRGYSR